MTSPPLVRAGSGEQAAFSEADELSPREPLPEDRVIARLLTDIRKARRLSQQEVADRVGVSCQQWQKYESARNRIPSGRLFRFCREMKESVRSIWQAVYPQALDENPGLSDQPYAGSLRSGELEALIEGFERLNGAQSRRALLALLSEENRAFLEGVLSLVKTTKGSGVAGGADEPS